MKSRVKLSLLRSTAQWCGVNTWKFSARELSRALKVRSQHPWIRTTCGSQIPRVDLEFLCRPSAVLVGLQGRGGRPGIWSFSCQSDTSGVDLNEEQVQKNDEGTDPGIRVLAPDHHKGEKREWRACLKSMTGGCFRPHTSHCRLHGTKRVPSVSVSHPKVRAR